MLTGAHMPNRAITAEDIARFALGKFQAAKLMFYHTTDDVDTLRKAGAQQIMVRLPDSRNPDGRYPSADEYARNCVAYINSFCRAGVRTFQVDNEPNWTWQQQEYGPWQYQYFMRLVVHAIRPQVSSDVRLVCPPLSFSPAMWRRDTVNPSPWTLDDWLAAYQWNNNGIGTSLWSLFDAVGVNAYWQSDRQMIDPSYGGVFAQIHARAGGRSVVVCEFGTSLCDRTPSPSGEDIQAAMEQEYPEWLMWAAEEEFVEAAYLFILGSNGDWAGYEPGPRALQAIAANQKRSKGKAA